MPIVSAMTLPILFSKVLRTHLTSPCGMALWLFSPRLLCTLKLLNSSRGYGSTLIWILTVLPTLVC
uniref:Uncharacterized protein n=1 Tax=Rhizophora mucronata TaxID=61149 RepID=A0A2P2Q5Y8_RHIMU